MVRAPEIAGGRPTSETLSESGARLSQKICRCVRLRMDEGRNHWGLPAGRAYMCRWARYEKANAAVCNAPSW
eukprot:CAMPEP_0183344240 /NCGR_PEP_ID=MMETSP0164_2-20130417/9971_1 /TAXON_ID=221442 /ORGANISM="Coccolithus pelagicus ssp braarudi, Strain PLY182g" /LENGTH=71 /DNA_ID=CAMNT_0025515211 /DNA_START=171 /DNA_END=386 /DNA_ORIENTATION=+